MKKIAVIIVVIITLLVISTIEVKAQQNSKVLVKNADIHYTKQHLSNDYKKID